MKTYFLILFLFVSLVSFGQRNSQSTELVDEIALSFERNSDSITLAEGGLKIVSIQSRDTSFYTDQGYPILYQSDSPPSDTLISFFETDTSLLVNYVVYESGGSGFGWISQIYFDKDTLTIYCEHPGLPMSVPPWWSPFSVAIEFQKTRPGKFEIIRINEIDYTLDKFTNQR